jgi:hypothetical protein
MLQTNLDVEVRADFAIESGHVRVTSDVSSKHGDCDRRLLAELVRWGSP